MVKGKGRTTCCSPHGSPPLTQGCQHPASSLPAAFTLWGRKHDSPLLGTQPAWQPSPKTRRPGPASERQAQLEEEQEPAATARVARGGRPRMRLGDTTASCTVASCAGVVLLLQVLQLLQAGVHQAAADLHPAAEGGSQREVASALLHMDEVEQLMAGKMPAFSLDYDGTLTPIVDNPFEARLSEEARSVLRSLAMRYKTAIVSGRARLTAHGLVQLDELCYAGSHGFDIAGPRKPHNIDSDDGQQIEHVSYSATDSYRPALEAMAKVEEVLGLGHHAVVHGDGEGVVLHHHALDVARVKALMPTPPRPPMMAKAVGPVCALGSASVGGGGGGGDGGGGGGGGGGGTQARGGSPRMQLSDEEVEAKLAKMRGSLGKPPEGKSEGGVVLGVEALEVGVVLVPLLALALFSIEEYVRARL